MKTIEDQIIDLMKIQDENFIKLIYKNYAPALYGIVIRIVKNEKLAKDVMQDSFVKVWKNAEKYEKNKAKLFTWLLRIFRNTAIDYLRKENLLHSEKIQNHLSIVSNTTYNHIIPETLDIKENLLKIEEKYRKVIQLLYLEGLTQKEASEKLSLPLGTIKSRLRLGLASMKKIYGSNYIIFFIYLIPFI